MRTSDLTLSLLAVGLCGSALAQVTRSALTSDFAPPHRVLRAGRFGEMKWEERLLTATSTDGLTFTRTNNIITDQARSPNLIIAGATLYLFYIRSSFRIEPWKPRQEVVPSAYHASNCAQSAFPSAPASGDGP